jgi:hypothetical protein
MITVRGQILFGIKLRTTLDLPRLECAARDYGSPAHPAFMSEIFND